MIRENKQISMAESVEFFSEKNVELAGFVKKFIKLNLSDAKLLKTKIESLSLLKLQPANIVKLIDFLPENQDELNKSVQGINLDDEESKKLLEIIKELR